MQETNQSILYGDNLDLTFGGVKALSNVSFRIKPGKIVSIIGPNGAGKTCLVNCITGYYRPEKGRLVFKNSNITGLNSYRIARMGISRTFQDPTTYPSLTALEILMSARYMHTRSGILESMIFFGKSRSENLASRKIVEEIISFARIEELRKIPLAAMSYGQRKQVEIARALVMEPEIVFLDEPMSGLDEIMKEIVTELIINVYKRGMTIVLVEHDMQVVMELSHSIIVLDHGQKIADGTPNDILHNPEVAEAYLGGITSELMTSGRASG